MVTAAVLIGLLAAGAALYFVLNAHKAAAPQAPQEPTPAQPVPGGNDGAGQK